MILYLLLVLRKINWMFLPQVEHCGETKTEMRGMVSAEIYHWAFTKKQLFTSFFWKAWLDYLITFTRRLAKQRLQFLFSFFFLSRHQGKTAKWFNLNFNTIDYWFYPEPVNEKDLKSISCLSDMIWRQHWPRLLLAGLTSGLLWVRPAPGRTSSCLPPSWNGRPWRTFSLGVFLYSGDHQHQQHNNNHDNPDPEEAVLPWQLALISLGSQIGSVSIAKLKLDRVSLLYGQINLSETHLQIGRGPFGNVTFQSNLTPHPSIPLYISVWRPFLL